MKKLLTFLLILALGSSLFVGCAKTDNGETTAPSDNITHADDDTGTTAMCQACGEKVEWTVWTSANTLPAEDGHFRLEKDIQLTATTTINQAITICLDLNGKTVTQTVDGVRVYKISNCCFNLMDSIGTGVIYPASGLKNGGESPWGQGFETNANSTLNIYGGTIDASNIMAEYSCCINNASGTVNLYGGKLIGGVTWGSGGSVLIAIGVFNMYGGEIIGGHAESSHKIGGGGAIRVTGIMHIYGGTIDGGTTNLDGGCIRVGGSATLYIEQGANISGGLAGGQGDNIYIQEGGKYFPHKDLVIDGVYDAN